jgi:hypothetical protein
LGVFFFAFTVRNVKNLVEKLENDHNSLIYEERENLDMWIL